jgi:hypothetical protein
MHRSGNVIFLGVGDGSKDFAFGDRFRHGEKEKNCGRRLAAGSALYVGDRGVEPIFTPRSCDPTVSPRF